MELASDINDLMQRMLAYIKAQTENPKFPRSGFTLAIKGIFRLFLKLDGKTRRAYHFCMNCLNDFRAESARDKHYEYCSSNGHVKAKIPTDKEKWLKFHDRQYQFKVPFMLYADFESILKPVDEWYRDRMNTMKIERKGKAPYGKDKHTCTIRMVCIQHLSLWRCP